MYMRVRERRQQRTLAKLGYARGGMPVAFVDRVRAYYDVLLAHQTPHQPRLQVMLTAAREPMLDAK
jgi:membrane-bound lytic murein transglycosylase MltF